ncbi:hypothetical protein HDV00_010579 [Rhizophlyctis rosea]|nr:hypothetical protein HDV00_010579 [Rhizophlyctis rosea]
MSAGPSVQDMPPPGGFPQTIRYERYLPRRGPSGVVMFGGLFLIMGYGWYHQIRVIKEGIELDREKRWNRINLVPLLQAELDRDWVRKVEAYKVREKGYMSEYDPEWAPLDLKAPTRGIGKNAVYDPQQSEPVYHTERYVRPTSLFLPWEEEARMESQWWRGFKWLLRNPTYHQRPDFTKEHPIGKPPVAE